MGEVYRARDLKLKREVAITILPEEFSRDIDSRCGRWASCRSLPRLQFDDLQSRHAGLNAVGGSVVMPLEASGTGPSADCYSQECTVVPVRRQ